MNSVRYYAALIVLVCTPPGFLLWFLIHPFARFWRRLGAGWTYAILTVPTLAVMAGAFALRGPLLVIEFGTSYILIGLAVLCLIGTAAIGVKRRKHLTLGILSGLPELSRDQKPGVLLTDGIYGKLRHPRYVEALLAILAYAFFANYLAAYGVFLLSLPVVCLIVVLEERELLDRFGTEYGEYCRRVPWFVPRRRSST